MDNKANVKLLSMAGQGGSAFGIALMELMETRNDIIVLSADMSSPAGLDKFKADYPDHFINAGIAEQNMIGIASGLSQEGFKVICVAQACFITMRCFEQVRQFVGYMDIPLILVGLGAGLSLQYMGNSHFALEDIAIMRTIPNMTVIAPCDSLEAIKALEFAVDSDDATYIRFWGGTSIPIVHQQDYDFNEGKPITLCEGNNIAIIATGSVVNKALQASKILADNGIECEVIDAPIIKPLNATAINNFASKRLIVTVEEHQINGGLGSTIADSLVRTRNNTPLLRIGIDNSFINSIGSYQYLLHQCGLDAESIANRIFATLDTTQ